jgi:endoglucanase
MKDAKQMNVTHRLLVTAALAASLGGCGGSTETSGELTSEVPALGLGGAGATPGGAAGAGFTPPVASPEPGLLAPAPVPEAPLPMDVVLDDFDDNDGTASGAGLSGSWRTYSDGTGMVTPAVGSPILPVNGELQVTGSGFATWGVGLSIDLDTSSGARQAADLSAYRGLTIRAKGTGTIDVELVLPGTTGTDEVGGTCTGEGCFGHYAAALVLGAEYEEQTLAFSSFQQPSWAAAAELDPGAVLAINFLSRANGAPVGIDLSLDSVSLAAPLPASPNPGLGGVATVNDGSNPFAGKTLSSDGGAAQGAYDSAQGAERDLLAKVAQNPSAYWLVGGDPARAGSIVDGAAGGYAVLVAYNIPDRDCEGPSQGGAGSPEEYQSWVDGVSSSLAGKEAAVVLEPDALALNCAPAVTSLLSYAVDSLRQNPGVAVYIDAGHSAWIGAGEMVNRLRAAGVEQATGFSVNVSNFQPTGSALDYGRNISAGLGGKPFVIDTSRNGQGARQPGDWCNPAGAGLGEAPTAATGDDAVHAFLWVKRPGESDGPCGQCASVQAGQFCTTYALELARNAVF